MSEVGSFPDSHDGAAALKLLNASRQIFSVTMMNLLQIRSGALTRKEAAWRLSKIRAEAVHSAVPNSLKGILAAPENITAIHEDQAVRITAATVARGAIERPRRHWVPSVFVTGSYEILSASCFEDMSTAYAQDPNVTTLRETGAEIVVSWPAAVESWQGAEFGSFAELASAMAKAIIRVRGSIARVADQERIFGKVNHGESVPFSALGADIDQRGGDKWLVVHHDPRSGNRPMLPVLTSLRG